MMLIAVLVATPAPDVNFYAVSDNVASGWTHQLLVRMIGQPVARLPFMPQPVMPERPRPHPRLVESPGNWALWYVTCDPKHPGCLRYTSYAGPVLQHAINLANQTTWPISTSELLACLSLAILIVWLYRMRGLRFAVPAALLLSMGQVLWSVDHHSGMFFIALMAAIWLAYRPDGSPVVSPMLDRGFVAVWGLTLALQVTWSFHCVRADILEPYDPGKAVAAFLQQQPVGRTAAFQFVSSSIQPYFAHNPFFNLPSSYWLWTAVDNPDAHFRETIASHPDRVVFAIDLPRPGMMEDEWAPLVQILSPEEERSLDRHPIVHELHVDGYRETHRFCGSRFMRLGVSMGACDIIYEPADAVLRPREGVAHG